MAQEFTTDRSTSDLLSRTQNVLRSHDRKLTLKERAAEQQRLAEKRSQPKVLEPWREEYRRAIEERYGKSA